MNGDQQIAFGLFMCVVCFMLIAINAAAWSIRYQLKRLADKEKP